MIDKGTVFAKVFNNPSYIPSFDADTDEEAKEKLAEWADFELETIDNDEEDAKISIFEQELRLQAAVAHRVATLIAEEYARCEIA